MKKSLISLMAVATALFVSSCAKEVLIPATEGNEATVSFTVSLDDAAATRATTIGSGLNCNTLVYEVYDASGVKIDALSDTKTGAFGGKHEETVTITLAKGQTYSFAFWAELRENGVSPYNTADLQNIKIDYATVCNAENRDAFFGNTEDITVTGNFAQPVTLKRPFAQLNLAVSDLADAKKAGIDPKQVKVVVSEVAGVLNAKTGAVKGAVADVEFSLYDILYKDGQGDNEMLELENPLEGGTETVFPWIAMNYLLVNDATTGAARSNADVTFTITTDKSDIVLTSTNTPLQRNWRTNIIAKLTSEGTFQVVIDPDFDNEYNGAIGENTQPDVTVYGVKAGDKYYKTLADALNAGESDIELAAGEYELNTNISNRAASAIADNVTITGADKEGVVVTIKGQVRAKDGVTSLTLKNLTTNVPTGLNYDEFNFGWIHYMKNFTMVDCKSNGRIRLNSHNALIDNCEFNMNTSSSYDGYAIFYGGATNSNVKVSNSTFNTAGKAILLYNESIPVLNLKVENCTFESSNPNTDKAAIQMHTEYGITGTVDIKNSTAIGFLNVNQGLYNELNNQNGTPTNKFVINVALADGVSIADGEYQISSAAGMAWFTNEVNKNNNTFSGKTVKLIENIDLNNKLWEPVGQTGATQFLGTFDGNNKTISNLKVDTEYSFNQYTAAGLFGWLNSATVKNVTVENAVVSGTAYVGTIAGYMEGTCTIEGCKVINAKVSGNYLKSDNEGDKVGGIVGYAGNKNNLVKDCTVSGSAIDAVRDAGQVVGAAPEANVVNCSATSTTVVNNTTAPADYAKNNQNINETVIGRVL